MSKKEGYSREGLFGTVYHYDAKGHKIGESRPAFLGGYNNYDAKGHKTGSVRPGFLGSQVHYDAKGQRIGTSDPGFWGDQKRTGNFGDNSNIINNAGSAAGVRRDERTIKTVIGIAAAGSSGGASQKVQNEWSDGEAVSPYPRTEESTRSDKLESSTSSSHASTVQYIIARSSSQNEHLYCQTNDSFQIGDWAVVEDTAERVQVLAVVECLEDALTPEAKKGLQVKAV